MLKTAAIAALLTAGALVPAANAATINVTTTADVLSPNDGQCSLREALLVSRSDSAQFGCSAGTTGVDDIRLPAGTIFMAAATAGPLDPNVGDFDTGPVNAVRIVGAGRDATAIDAGGFDRLFRVYPNASLTLQDLTIRNGRSAAGANGGAVFNQGSLILQRVNVENNAAGGGTGELESGAAGGAIWSGGTASPSVIVADSLFRGNAAGKGADGRSPSPNFLVGGGRGGPGGAIALESGTADVSATTFAGNRAGDGGAGASSPSGGASEGAGGDGGAISASGSANASVINSTFAGNAAGAAGVPSPFPNNRQGGQGAATADVGATLRITWSTFAGNTPGARAPDAAAHAVSRGQVSASLFAETGPACRAVSAPAVLANVVPLGDRSCAGPTVDGDARLGALAANGGGTPTLLPGTGSAAIDALGAGPCPGTDQRGLPRPALGGCDAGAVEVQPAPPAAGGAGTAPVRRTLAPGGTTTLRRISGVTLSRSAFRTYGKKKGTTVGVRLSVPSSIVLTVTKPATGRRSKGKCVAPTKTLAGKARCTRQVPLRGSLSKAGKAGLNTIAFAGKLRGRALAPGAYTFVITLPKSGAATAVVATKGFRVIP